VGVAAILRPEVLRARSATEALRAQPVDDEGTRSNPSDYWPAIISTAVAAVLSGIYLLMPLTGQDMSAQLARSDFAYTHPTIPVDLRWFGGSLQFGYSLWAPWLGGLIGSKLLGALAAVAGTWFGTRLMQRAEPMRPLWGGIALAVCQVADIMIGRITYQCGLVAALVAALAVLSERRAAGFVLAFLAGAASPVVTLGLWTYAAAGLVRRRFGDAIVLAVGSGAATAIVSVYFSDGGDMTFPTESFARAVTASLLVIILLPMRHNVIRLGAVLNLAVVIVAAVVDSPIGSNAERLGLIFAIPILAAFVEWRTWIAAGVVVASLIAQPPVTSEVYRLAGVPATHDSYYQPLVTAIRHHAPLTGRVEVPEINGHWDAALLAKQVPLARGWLRQVDKRLNDDVFFKNPPTESTYHRWLTTNAVQYVAVPDAKLTPYGRREKALVQGWLPYLKKIWQNKHWTLYAVTGATPIVAAPAKLVSMDAARLVVSAPRNTIVRIRIRWFKWTTLNTASGGCIAPDDDQLALHTGKGRGTGRYVISSSADPRKSGSKRGHC
jgi:hypothetical protein